jgi:ribonuclease HI
MYVVNCFKKNWLRHWERELWPERIKNQDLLKEILSEYRKFPRESIHVYHVKGHNGDERNEYVDSLASYRNFEEFYEDKI